MINGWNLKILKMGDAGHVVQYPMVKSPAVRQLSQHLHGFLDLWGLIVAIS